MASPAAWGQGLGAAAGNAGATGVMGRPRSAQPTGPALPTITSDAERTRAMSVLSQWLNGNITGRSAAYEEAIRCIETGSREIVLSAAADNFPELAGYSVVTPQQTDPRQLYIAKLQRELALKQRELAALQTLHETDWHDADERLQAAKAEAKGAKKMSINTLGVSANTIKMLALVQEIRTRTAELDKENEQLASVEGLRIANLLPQQDHS